MVLAVATPAVGTSGGVRVPAPLLLGLRSPCGRTVLSFTMAGGVLLGGALVALLVFVGAVSPDTVRMFSGAFFVAGAAGGLVQGVVLAVLGREEGASPGSALLGAVAVVPWLLPALALSGVAAAWLSLSWAALHLDRAGVVLGAALGCAAALATCAWAAAEGAASARRALSRWPGWPVGVGAPAGIFCGLAAWLHVTGPAIPLTRLPATGTAAVVVAAVLTLWVGIPAVAAALFLARRAGAAARSRASGPRAPLGG